MALRPISLLATILLAATTPCEAGDLYFDRALAQIEHNLAFPGKSFGAQVSDTLQSASGSVISKHDYAFFTDAGRTYFNLVQYDPSNWDRIYGKELTIKIGDGPTGKAQRGSLLADGRYVLFTNVEARSAVIGEADVYCYGNPDFNHSHPEMSPYQLLVNPCFAPLHTLPADIRATFQEKQLSDDNGDKVFELSKDDGSERTVILMEFSPRLGDILVKSDMVQGPATTQPVSASVPTWRLERSITEFTKLDDGHFVPKVFLMTRSQNGQVDERLERRVSKAALGKVPNSLFNFKEQLSGPWDSTVDGPTQTDVSSTTKSAGQ